MAYGVQSQKFLCCFPTRLGVFVLSFFHFCFAGFIAAVLWADIGLNKDVKLDRSQKGSAIAAAIYNTLFALIALLAFYGTIRRHLSLVQTYATTLGYALGVSLVIGIINLIYLFRDDKQDIISKCIDGSIDQNVINACQHVNTIRYVMLGFFIASWLLGFYEVIIVQRYALQLGEEQREKFRLKSMKSNMYDTIPGRESTEAFAVQFPGAISQGAGPSSIPPYADAKGEVKLYESGSREDV